MFRGLAEVHGRWFYADGMRLYARTSAWPGVRKNLPIVLVHGMVVSSRYLSRLAATLGTDFPCYAPDLPGFGRSQRPRHLLTLPELADALVAFMDAANLERALLLGNSFGCQIAVEAAVRHPQRVAKLVLQGPTSEAGQRQALRQLALFLLNGTRDSAGMLPILVRDYAAAGPRQALHTFRICRLDPIEEKLHGVQAPTLVVSGARDPITTPRWGERVAQLLPDARHVILPGVAHTAVFAAPLHLARAVRAFAREEPVKPVVPAPNAPPPRYVAAFDSALAMLSATGRALHGEDFPGPGLYNPLEPFAPLANLVPRRMRAEVYRLTGGLSAIGPSELARLKLEDIDQWTVDQYPERRYPAIFIGSSNGALAHLAAAMDAPWLPQTLLIPVRHPRGRVHDPQAALAWGRKHGPALLAARPDIQLHHMHDPNQDLLMSAHMAYFRIKRRRLNPAWTRFIERCLRPDGVIYLVDCQQRWPCTQVSERHYFQLGGLGGLTPEEYLHGSPRVASWLRRQRVRQGRWNAPRPDITVPEAEWGFENALADDVLCFARSRGYRVRWLRFGAPDDLSPVVADIYRQWYQEHGLRDERLLVESFVLLAPFWALRTGSIPYWCSFNVEPSARRLAQYLENAPRFEQIFMTLFSHGVTSAGLAPIAQWQALLNHGRKPGAFVGVNPRAYPADFGVFRHYHTTLPRLIQARHAIPPVLAVEQVERAMARLGLECADAFGSAAHGSAWEASPPARHGMA